MKKLLAQIQHDTMWPMSGKGLTVDANQGLVSLSAGMNSKVTQGLGAIVVYGDTDSVMFVIPDTTVEYSAQHHKSTSEQTFTLVNDDQESARCNLMSSYVESICNRHNMSRKETLQYLSGSDCFKDLSQI